MDRLKNDGTSIFNRFMKPLTEVPFPLKGAIHPQLAEVEVFLHFFKIKITNQ